MKLDVLQYCINYGDSTAFFRRIVDESPAVYAVTPAVRSPNRRTLIKLHDYILPIAVIQFIVTTVGNINISHMKTIIICKINLFEIKSTVPKLSFGLDHHLGRLD